MLIFKKKIAMSNLLQWFCHLVVHSTNIILIDAWFMNCQDSVHDWFEQLGQWQRWLLWLDLILKTYWLVRTSWQSLWQPCHRWQLPEISVTNWQLRMKPLPVSKILLCPLLWKGLTSDSFMRKGCFSCWCIFFWGRMC